MAMLQSLPDLFSKMRKDLAEDIHQAVREGLHATLFATHSSSPTAAPPIPSRKRKAIDLTDTRSMPMPMPMPSTKAQDPVPTNVQAPVPAKAHTQAQDLANKEMNTLVTAFNGLPKELRIMLRKKFMGSGKRGAASAEEKAHVMRQYIYEQQEQKLEQEQEQDQEQETHDETEDDNGGGSDSKTNNVPHQQSSQSKLPSQSLIQSCIPVARALPGLSGSVFKHPPLSMSNFDFLLQQTPNA